MRSRYLEIEGLQSFKELQKIDFDKLGETGLFGIFGPTGSGKSTVLDAITLALYGSVQRAFRGTQGIINTGCSSIRVAFTFDLLKDGSRKTYRVERVYGRKKGTENSAEARLARLVEVRESGDIPLADKTGEVTGKIIELIGLELDDFTRSVVLPQNKFQEFLLSTKAEKRAMLERIFYLEEYGRKLNEKVARKLALYRNSLSETQGALSALGDVSEKSLVEAENNVQAAREYRDKVDQELKRLEIQYNRAREVWDLTLELAHVLEKEEELKAELDNINQKRMLYESSVRAEGLMEIIHKFRNLSDTLNNVKKLYSEVCGQLTQESGKLEELRTSFSLKQEESEKIRPGLIELKARLHDALAMSRDAAKLENSLKLLREQYSVLRKQIAETDEKINQRRAEQAELLEKIGSYKARMEELKVDVDYRSALVKGVGLENDLQNAENEINSIKKRYEDQAAKISEQEKELQEIALISAGVQGKLEAVGNELKEHEASRPGDRKGVIERINRYHEIRALSETVSAKMASLDKETLRLSQLQNQLKECREKARQEEDNRKGLETKLTEIQNQIRELEEIHNRNSAYNLAMLLKEGEPCPVCGSSHHPKPASEAVAVEMEELIEKLEALKNKHMEYDNLYRKSESACAALNEQLRSMNEQVVQAQAEVQSLESEYKAARELLPAEMRDVPGDRLKEMIEAMAVENESRIKELEKWEARLDELKNNASLLSDEASRHNSTLKSKKAQLDANKAHLFETQKLLDEAGKVYNEKIRRFKEFLSAYGITSAIKEMKRVEENDRQLSVIQKQAAQAEAAYNAAGEGIERLNEERRALFERYSDIKAQGESLKGRKDEIERRVAELSAGKDIESEIAVIDTKLGQLEEELKKLQVNIKEAEDLCGRLNAEKNRLESQKEMITQNLESEENTLKQQLSEKGFQNIQSAEASLLPKDKQSALESEIKEYEQAQRNIEAQKNMLERKLEGRTITEDEWRLLCENYEKAREQKEESISRLESARSIYNTIAGNFKKWLELGEKFQAQQKKVDALEFIQKLLKGNAFVEFIAEERLRYVAREATETLGMLTGYRYQLELDSDNGFVIRDNSNGGVHRPVSSLSGGETFLTSLSLALALSKQIQLKGQCPLEFFFLDEGFGTLDGNLLDTVMDALEKLSTRDRVIGLISHVPELRSRMARKLTIEPPSVDGKGSRVRLEKG